MLKCLELDEAAFKHLNSLEADNASKDIISNEKKFTNNAGS